MNSRLPLFALLLALAFTSCVLPKKFHDMEAQRNAANDKNAQLEVEIADARNQISQLQAVNRERDNTILRLQDTISQLRQEIQTTQNRYDNLLRMQELAQRGSQQEQRRLLAQIQEGQDALQEKESELHRLERELNERNQRLLTLEQALSRQDSLTNALRRTLSDALIGFEGNGLTVQVRNGRVYVSMENQLLFATGSFEVDTRGARAIRNIARVLEQNSDINVVIEGHTDDVPFRGSGQLEDNWDLSVKRATSVVRLMLRGTTIDESRITAAGRSQYAPIRRGQTAEARAANRRIEIILTPRLDEVLRMLE